MFGFKKKKKEERPVNGTPGTAVKMLSNAFMKDISTVSFFVNSFPEGTYCPDFPSAYADGSEIDAAAASEALRSLLRVQRLETVTISGGDPAESLDAVMQILDAASVFNVDKRIVYFNARPDIKESIDRLAGKPTAVVIRAGGDGCLTSGEAKELEDRGISVYVDYREGEKPVENVHGIPDELHERICSAGGPVPASPDMSEPCGTAPGTKRPDRPSRIYVGPKGDVRVCGFPIGNINEQDLLTIVESYDPYASPIISMILESGCPAGLASLGLPQGPCLSRACDVCRAAALKYCG
ncbi:MAG: hypothetical protein ACOX6J_02440 [Oscillospiraceae bacterium]|jgi:hypothetical protein